ncbi:subclass B3 metallo-beta-lactamase [Sphingomonas aracearum]|uniref:Subclass B3 metallo-beta-lactamase n=1 Tax=Sphingomonas aracearum TaxID=2283317 RepID=A0A369W0A3_9SPHN|nr:subclass B3 metallo-beta-lactamase [Sphingomonas aracearum]RDE05511.1 subclass B3 metallo-beta-lactamase [Sphingomonas aracearum]
MFGGASRRWATRRFALACAASVCAAPALAQDPPAWTRPIAPFHIVGPVWYVGTEGLGSYAIRTRAGVILIDGTMAENVPAILANLRRIGVRPRDVKLMLSSHAHADHAAGDAALQRATGAPVLAGTGDVEALRTGMPPGETSYPAVRFPAVPRVRPLRDGQVVRLGGARLTAVATPGHTPGCLTWTMRVEEEGRPLDLVFPCSLTVAGNRLVGNRRYPGIVEDFRKSFDRVDALHADVVLPMHPEFAEVMERRQRGDWVAPGLLQRMVADARRAFARDLAAQQAR